MFGSNYEGEKKRKEKKSRRGKHSTCERSKVMNDLQLETIFIIYSI